MKKILLCFIILCAVFSGCKDSKTTVNSIKSSSDTDIISEGDTTTTTTETTLESETVEATTELTSEETTMPTEKGLEIVHDYSTNPPETQPTTTTVAITTTEAIPLTVNVSIPEGYSFVQIANLMEANHICSKDDLLATVNTYDFRYYDLIGKLEDTTNRAFKVKFMQKHTNLIKMKNLKRFWEDFLETMRYL